mmetsp:Transcript_16659/g.47803  ORF Transcript_16659/g.47803 Transcript_16659/m.47803 type:complete len:342 (-) Transcript_16659:34-1059(-)
MSEQKDETASPGGTTATPMPLLPITSPQTVELCASLPLRSSDVFICSYPKSGTTWTQHIVLSLLVKSASKGRGGDDYLQYSHVSEYAPFYEVDGHWDSQARDLNETIRTNHKRLGRRVFNTHLRWDMLPSAMEGAGHTNDDTKAKFIYLLRDPMDVCLSFYCHLSNQMEGGYDGTFQDFFDEWINGDIAFGSYSDHILSFAPAFVDAGHGREVLLISYEEMLSDLPLVLKKLAAFVEADVTSEEIVEMLPTFSFGHMKGDLDRFQPRSVTWKNNFQFLRRGVSGDSLTVASDRERKALANWFEREHVNSKLESILLGNNNAALTKFRDVCCSASLHLQINK